MMQRPPFVLFLLVVFTSKLRCDCYSFCCSGFLISRLAITKPTRQRSPSRTAFRAKTFGNDFRDDDYDDDYDDEEEWSDIDTSKFVAPKSIISFGLGKGRSPPSQRKAMGKSGSSTASVYSCTNCGSEFVKWMGRCPTCRQWNTIQEFRVNRSESTSQRPSFSTQKNQASWVDGGSRDFENQPVRVTDVYKQTSSDDQKSYHTRNKRIKVPDDNELNTVLGGGIMPGSLILLGGDPGVGKSTLVLQTAGKVASLSTPTRGIGMGLNDPNEHSNGLGPVWYVSGEENSEQIASRALRLGIHERELWLLAETHVDTLAEQVVASYHPNKSHGHDDENAIPKPPSLLVIDSIQTMVCEAGGSSAAGGVTQVRESVALFLRLAKSTGIPVFLVGHVTKSGDVAGPRTVEHMVDVVMYLEGGNANTIGGVNLRMLRAAKNRFGSADEVGVYEMTSGQLQPVTDPSSLFLSNREDSTDVEGCGVALVLEGLRAMAVEIQALVTPVVGGDGMGRRTVDGIAYNRLSLLIGILQKRCGLFFRRQDVYINVVGKMRLDHNREGASSSDLAVAVSLVSSLLGIPVRADTAFVGEVGLLGELRPVPALDRRIQEARRMGFSRIVTPKEASKKGGRGSQNTKTHFTRSNGMDWIQCGNLMNAINEGLVRHVPRSPRKRTQSNKSNDSVTGGDLCDLMLDDVILDDGDDDDDNIFG